MKAAGRCTAPSAARTVTSTTSPGARREGAGSNPARGTCTARKDTVYINEFWLGYATGGLTMFVVMFTAGYALTKRSKK